MNLVGNRNNRSPDTFKSLSRVESIRREAAAELNKFKRNDSDRDFIHTPKQSSNNNFSNTSKILLSVVTLLFPPWDLGAAIAKELTRAHLRSLLLTDISQF